MLPSRRRPLVVLIALFAVAFAASVVGAAGCATERKPINKVQANALAKSFFIGKPGDPADDPEFYFRNFVVDASESQELIGIGSWGGIDRVKWEVSEKMLFARRSYGQNEGADDKGATSGFPNGTIVAAYPINSHFDVKRDYNPQTGEELNVVVENTTDRPWYEREYFRVDWSVNQVDTPQWVDMFIGKLTGEIKVTPIAYYVSDPSRDDAPHFDSPGGYFDVTSKFLVEPAKSIYDWLPQCAFVGFVTGSNIQNCDGQEAVVRSSYLRVDQVDPNGDFEPFENTRAPEDIFGNPGGAGNSIVAGIETPARVTYDPGYGYTDAGLKRLMHVHNIWKQSHQEFGTCAGDADCKKITGNSGSACLPSGKCTLPCSYDARRDGGGNGTDDQCENRYTHYKGSQGSQCSVRNRCTIPYRDRETKPIEWWVNPEMPGSLQDEVNGSGKLVALGATEDVVFTWNQAIKLAVAHAREVECRRTGSHEADERATCHAQFFDPGKTEMISYGGWGIEQVLDKSDLVVTCHNPVRDYDPVECGERGLRARVGDLRHNFIFYWPFASRAPWGGIANWNGDPLTGQMIGAAATVMGRSSTNSAAQIRDVLMVANGELTMADITGGTPAALYQQRLQVGETRRALPKAEIARRMSGVDLKHAAAALGLKLAAGGVERLDQIRDLKANSRPDPGVRAGAFAEIDGLVKPLLGTQFETRLMSPSWLVDAAGLSPTTTLDEATLARVSPLRGRDPARMVAILGNTLSALGAHGVCTFAAGDGVGNPEIRGLAKWFGGLNQGIYGDDVLRKTYPELAKADLVKLSDKRAELIYDHLTRETYKGIALHEVGHALGMFHNWASSYDAANYDPQYWQLRTNDGQAADSCNGDPRADGSADTCMGPRFLDPETDDELGQGSESRPGIKYFGHTSTMEYQQERFFETVGLGQYDLMTMGALYGRVLETLDPDATDGIPSAEQGDYESLNFTQLTEDDLVFWTPPNGIRGIQGMHYTELGRHLKLYDASRCRDATKSELAQAEWRIVHGQVCRPPPKDHAAWGDFIENFGPRSAVAPNAPAGAGNVRWPYRFGQNSDAYVQINPFDSGADIYEVTKAEIERFTYSYPFRYFRRQRRDWNYETLPSLDAANFFERLRAYHWVAARNNATVPSAAQGKTEEFLATDDLVRTNVLAEHAMFEGIAQALLVPQIGPFDDAAPSLTLGGTRGLLDAIENPGRSSPALTLDASNARFVDPDYDTGAQAGGSWDYHHWIIHAGFDVEKANAAMALTDGRPTLAIIQRDTYLDGRHLYINFRTDMARAVDRVIGGILANDWESIASSVPRGGTEPQLLDFAGVTPVRAADPADVSLLFPNLGYRQQLGAIIWAQLFSREGTELTLANKLLMYVEGTEGVIDIDTATGATAADGGALPGAISGKSVKTKFRDPRSGFTYVARLYGPDVIDGKTVDSGISSRMLAHANDLLTLAYQVEKDGDGKPIANEFGGYDATLDAVGQPVPVGGDTELTAYADYVGLLDATVQISKIFGHGPF